MTEPIDDPYRVLGVARDASDEEIRTAYEKRLAGAAAAGALQAAQRVDAAYELLRDRFRRDIFDREGRIVDIRRPMPEMPAAAVRFREWSPAESDDPRPRVGCGRRRRSTLIGAVVAAALSASALVSIGPWNHPAAGQSLTGDIWQSRPISSNVFPAIRTSAHRARVLPEVSAPASRAPYKFAIPGPSGPIRWDPCAPIRYVISGNEPFVGALKLLNSAIGEVSRDTGLQFVYAGESTEQPSGYRAAYQPSHYGKRWAPVLVAWTDATVLPQLAGRTVGLGGGMSVTIGGQPRVVTGMVALDGPDLARTYQSPRGAVVARAVMLHELGHLVGLAHVNDKTQVMYPTAEPLAHYSAGDRAGLAILGSGPCSTEF